MGRPDGSRSRRIADSGWGRWWAPEIITGGMRAGSPFHINSARNLHLYDTTMFLLAAHPISSRPSVNSIPSDIILEIVTYLHSLSDKLNFSRTVIISLSRAVPPNTHHSLQSSHIFARVIPSIYSSVELDGIEECEATLSMLAQSPHLARHVRKLVVHPESTGSRRQPKFLRAWNYAHTVSSLVGAACQHMDALHTFSWDGEDSLPDDAMWEELRTWCVAPSQSNLPS